jgi:hypothetical protein
MKSLSKNLKNKNAAVAVATLLMAAIAVSLVVIPMSTAMTGVGWEVSITGDLSGNFRSYVYYNGEEQGWRTGLSQMYGAYLRVKAPSATEWTDYGPYDMPSWYRLYFSATYTDWTELGVYQFQWKVPPQAELPPNPDTSDHWYYSDILELSTSWRIYIDVNVDGRVRGEVQLAEVRQQLPFENITLLHKGPGATTWTDLGPLNTTNGRVDYYYDLDEEYGVHQFQYIVPPQGELPVNEDTADGRWYSDIAEIDYSWSIYISSPSTAYPNIAFEVRAEMRLANVRQTVPFADVMLAHKAPGAASWTYLGPYGTTNGRIDADFTAEESELGVHQFQYIVPPQGDLPTNPDTADGKWYSEVSETDVVKEVFKSYCFINAVPNPVGVGQEVLMHVGITRPLQSDWMGWEGITVEVTKPDNTTEILGGAEGFTTDSTGGTGTVYTPDQVGNYTLRTHFPEQQTNADKSGGGAFFGAGMPVGAYMGEAYSIYLTLVVNEESITYYPGFALPKEYWTRPIDAQIREWYEIAGSSFEPEYNDAPESAHVLWAKRLEVEGTIGGTVDTRENYSSRIIISGILLYNTEPMADVSQYYRNPSTVAVDVRTGEELYRIEDLRIDWGQIYYHDSINRHCAYAYAWSLDEETRTASCYDPWNGNYLYQITDFPEGPMSLGPIGEMLVYQIDFEERYMHVWNSSWQYMEGKTGMAEAWNARGTTQRSLPKFAASRGWQLNITLPEGLTGEIREVVWSERVVGVDIQDGKTREWAFSLEPGEEGTLLWDRTVNYALPNVTPATVEGPVYVNGSIENHVHIRYQESTGKSWAFSLDTGDLLWKSGDFDATANGELALNLERRDTKIAYGMLYTTGPGGTVYAYDLQKGLNWTYSAWDNASEVVEGTIYWSGIALISDGKIYVAFGEPAQGAPFVCLDAVTGDELWRTDGMFRQTWGGPNVLIGDSVIVTLDTYDMRVYAIGKGPTAVTVSAPSVSVPCDTPVTVKGTVTDISPGTWDPDLGTYMNMDTDKPPTSSHAPNSLYDGPSALKSRFPNGVPAVSDESMSEWMAYVYKNLPRPTDVKGAEVVVYVLDSNDNYYEIARTVADSNGVYNCEFVPPVPGKYSVYATFEGSNSYYGSVAETTIVVEDALPATPPPTPEPESIADTYFVPAIAGIIVAIVVIGALLALLILKKR